MSAQSHRVFVGNLPHEATKDDILSKFEKYGTVESVEIRTKKDACTGDPLATFSFVNISADRDTLNQCASLLNGIKIGGRNIKVELAKESFLQRLQRERQAGNKTAPPTVPNHSQPIVPKKVTETFVNKSVQEKKDSTEKSSARSSKFFDSEDEDVQYHHSGKLPMFKGFSSQASNEKEFKPQLVKDKFKSSFSNSNDNSGINKRSSKIQFQSENSDILKKFESFSDVWKDDDEPSHQEDSFGSKFRQGDKRQSFDKFADRNSANNWQSQNQLHQRNGSQAGSLSGSLKPVSAAEEKRLKSLDEKRQTFEQQKNAIKLALSSESSSQRNNKIVFGEDDEPEGLHEEQHSKRTPKSNGDPKQNTLKLFNESDDEAGADDWNDQFQVKKQFQGEKGKKLLQLQSNFNNDQRFKLDERFYEDGEETTSKPSNKPQTKSDLSEEGVDTVEGTEGLAEEREQQLQILSNILGQSIPSTLPPVRHESKRQGMLRFDPSKPNHGKYELSKEPKEKKKRKKKNVNQKDGEEDEEEDDDDEEEEESNKRKFRREEKDPEPVSDSQFYTVSGALADSLRQSKEGESSGFSLLQMFGSSNVPAERNKKEIEPRMEPLRKNLKQQPLLEDSSSDEEDLGPTADYNATAKDTAFPISNPGIRSSHGVWQESFFMHSGDTRLKEGIDFFSVKKDENKPDLSKKRFEITKLVVRSKRRLKWRKKDMLNPKPRGVQHSKNTSSKHKVHNIKHKRKAIK